MALLSDPQNHMTGLQWSALQGFFSSPVSAQFFLTGGTALAGFYFGHRTSVDLDFFSLQTFDHLKLKEYLEAIARSVGGGYEVRTDADSLLTGIIKVDEESLKIDLVHDIPVHIGILQTAGTIRIDALQNIGSNKITAIYGRLALKSLPGKSHSTARPSLSAANRSSLLEVDTATPSSSFTVFARN